MDNVGDDDADRQLPAHPSLRSSQPLAAAAAVVPSSSSPLDALSSDDDGDDVSFPRIFHTFLLVRVMSHIPPPPPPLPFHLPPSLQLPTRVEHSDAWSRPSTLGSDAVQQHYVTSAAVAPEAVDEELKQSESAQGAVLSGVAGDIGAGVSACGSLCMRSFLPRLTIRRPYEPFTFTVCRAGFGRATSTAVAAAACRRRIICLLLCVSERQKCRRQGGHDG